MIVLEQWTTAADNMLTEIQNPKDSRLKFSRQWTPDIARR